MPDSSSAKRRGRPTLPPGEKKGVAMGFRPSSGLRARLEMAAEKHGRSLSQEIEFRLETSFLLTGETPGRGAALAMVLGLTERMTGRSIREDRQTRELAQENVGSAVMGLAGFDPVFFSLPDGDRTAKIELYHGVKLQGENGVEFPFSVLLDLLYEAGGS